MFSNQKAEESGKNSKSIIRVTIVNIYKLFHGDASEEELDKIVEKYQYPVRKIAHFTEYFILGILIFLCFKEYNNKNDSNLFYIFMSNYTYYLQNYASCMQ